MISNKLPKSAETVRGHNISKMRNINKNITLTCLGFIHKELHLQITNTHIYIIVFNDL